MICRRKKKDITDNIIIIYFTTICVFYLLVMGYWRPASFPKYVGEVLQRSKCYCVSDLTYIDDVGHIWIKLLS